ncbi:MAG: hypothetical protein JOZ24_05025 [Candidatus Eremiobacteraeota bacterium]|nr:hypothetical protein [Candidatus Eremiobacteraeota bacterium]
MTAGAPVTISGCAISDDGGPTWVDFGPPVSSRTLHLSFLNTQDRVITSVTFDVRHGGAHAALNDHGRFSKDTLIEHVFTDATGALGDGPVRCTVRGLTFADGTTWSEPDAEPSPRAALLP